MAEIACEGPQSNLLRWFQIVPSRRLCSRGYLSRTRYSAFPLSDAVLDRASWADDAMLCPVLKRMGSNMSKLQGGL